MRKRFLSLALLAAFGVGVAPAFVPSTSAAAAQPADKDQRDHRWHWHHRYHVLYFYWR